MMDASREHALKPCPFCGSAAEQDYMRGYAMYPSGKPDHGAAIYCTACNADMMICREDMPELSDEERMAILEENWNRRAESFNCKARQQGSAGGNTPADCDWPVCGCDPAADRVIASLEENGIIASPLHIPIEAGNGADGWLDISSAPTDGTKFDAWCRHPEVPEASGVRFTDVQMRGDKSGFGFVIHLRDGAHWHYLDARDPDSIYPAWFPTHWRPLPAPPSTPSNEGREKA